MNLFRIAALFGLAPLLCAQTALEREAFREITDQPGLPRVLLIGDSISIGYTLPVRNALSGKANVHRIPTNGADTRTGLANLDKWLGDAKWDVIHFNWGLHDLKINPDGVTHQVPIEEYKSNLRKLVARMQATGAKLIWATTTPVPLAGNLQPPRRAADVPLYNGAARRVMEQAGIAVDDLYGVVLPRESEIQRPANVHFTEAGYDVLAGQVAASIAQALSR